jgi:hypothetical protein
MLDPILFERNLLALSAKDPLLCSRLSAARTTLGRYRFLRSRKGELVPALLDAGGNARPLHSLIDPQREGRRLINGLAGEDGASAGGMADGFLVFFGLGGGFSISAALERRDIHLVLAVDYDINGIAELLASRDYIDLFHDPRFHLLIDPNPDALETRILHIYQPVLFGGIRVIPLRARTEMDPDRFNRAGETVRNALNRLSGDYSVQAYFGTRWFSNIIRNCFQAEQPAPPLPPIRDAALCAAGPSLDEQLPLLKEQGASRFIIATDTSLPSLLQGGITPNAVISIDCQHISYQHFMRGLPNRMLLFLDLASPSLLGSLGDAPHFFSGGHPLTRYISRYWRPFPEIDTSGANVTYAALSLAEYLGAERIELYGADFSYPLGRTYARGTYIYPYFAIRQNRLSSLEALFSAFLYRSGALQKISRDAGSGGEGSWYYETPVLRNYRERLEAKARRMEGVLYAPKGKGAPIRIAGKEPGWKNRRPIRLFSAGKASMGAKAFLSQYQKDLEALPALGNRGVARYLQELGEAQSHVLTTLLPAAAALKRREPASDCPHILEAVKTYSLQALNRVLKARD